MKKLSKKDRIILAVAGVALAIALCCQGWYYWPWFGGKVMRPSRYDWARHSLSAESSSYNEPLPYITNSSPYSNHQVLKYFKDIACRMEYDRTVDTCRKWVDPIVLYVTGEYNQDNLQTIQYLCSRLNQISGFPGISQTEHEETANIVLRFLGEDDMNNASGKSTFGYFNIDSSDSYGNITKTSICVRSSMPTEKVSSVLCEELLQSLGPMNDTKLTEDTLFYQYKWDHPLPTELDWTLLAMLYHPMIRSDMDYIHCLPFFLEYLK